MELLTESAAVCMVWRLASGLCAFVLTNGLAAREAAPRPWISFFFHPENISGQNVICIRVLAHLQGQTLYQRFLLEIEIEYDEDHRVSMYSANIPFIKTNP